MEQKWKRRAGNSSELNPQAQPVTPETLMCSVTESMDDMDGDGRPIVSEQNVLLAKSFVDDNEK